MRLWHLQKQVTLGEVDLELLQVSEDSIDEKVIKRFVQAGGVVFPHLQLPLTLPTTEPEKKRINTIPLSTSWAGEEGIPTSSFSSLYYQCREKLNEWTVKRPESTLIRGESSGLPFTAMDWHPYQQLLAFALYSQSQEASCIVLYHLHHQSFFPTILRHGLQRGEIQQLQWRPFSHGDLTAVTSEGICIWHVGSIHPWPNSATSCWMEFWTHEEFKQPFQLCWHPRGLKLAVVTSRAIVLRDFTKTTPAVEMVSFPFSQKSSSPLIKWSPGGGGGGGDILLVTTRNKYRGHCLWAWETSQTWQLVRLVEKLPTPITNILWTPDGQCIIYSLKQALENKGSIEVIQLGQWYSSSSQTTPLVVQKRFSIDTFHPVKKMCLDPPGERLVVSYELPLESFAVGRYLHLFMVKLAPWTSREPLTRCGQVIYGPSFLNHGQEEAGEKAGEERITPQPLLFEFAKQCQKGSLLGVVWSFFPNWLNMMWHVMGQVWENGKVGWIPFVYQSEVTDSLVHWNKQ